jgi:flagellar biosynthesis chaperone FliJ
MDEHFSAYDEIIRLTAVVKDLQTSRTENEREIARLTTENDAFERQLAIVTDQRDELAAQCNLNRQGVAVISDLIAAKNHYKNLCVDARNLLRNELCNLPKANRYGGPWTP